MKRWIRKIITYSLRLLLKRKNIVSSYFYTIYSSRKQTFFGYYDKSPFSRNGKIMLAMTSDIDNKGLTKPSKIDIGYFRMDTPNSFNRIGDTLTWCWQQGCRLMWFKEHENETIIYNKIVNNEYGSVVQKVANKAILKKFSFPIYDINKSGTLALSLNFSRLHRLRPGYGYVNFPDITKGSLCPENDGIWLCDLDKNKKKLIISLDSIAKIDTFDTMVDAEHYINHLSFNPMGNKFLFFHLWLKNGVRYNRGIISNLDGTDTKILNNEGFVSHYCWKNNDEVLIYSSINKNARYYLYNIISDKISSIAKKRLMFDGHPSYLNDTKCIITDTYPSRILHEQSLLYYNIERNKLHKIASMFSSSNYRGEVRCDLHPRVSEDDKYVCVDVPFKAGRKMAVFDIRGL